MSKLTHKQFLERAYNIHGDKYNYDKSEYINQNTEVIIYCNNCEKDFLKQPVRHIHRKVGCPLCSKTKKLTKELFVKKAQEIHGNKYDYYNYVYTNDSTKSEILCDCGNIFNQSYMNHVRLKQGCPICNGGVFVPLQTQLERANVKHHNKYDYSLISEDSYNCRKEKQWIICPIHKKFKMQLNNHLNGQGCPKCKKAKPSITFDDIIKRSSIIHDNKYSYNKIEYKNMSDKLSINCSTHGTFFKIASRHVHGKQGCPICKSSKGEELIFKILKEQNIHFIKEYRFKYCRNKNMLPFDFYLPDYNTLIEYDGIQHFKPIKFFGGEKALKNCKINDSIKTNFCEDNYINLLRINYKENENDIKRKLSRVYKNEK